MSPGGALRAVSRASRRREAVVAVLFVALVTMVLTVHLAARVEGSEADRCERFAADAAGRTALVTGAGQRVVVIGDSYSVGLGLGGPEGSWPTRLPGEVHVAGFSGSGFSRGASSCEDVSFAERAPGALIDGADLVVVEGGLNDHDQPSADVRAGFRQLFRELDDHRVVVVGPPSAPARAATVARVDELLARLSARHGAAYVATSGWDLPYLPDRLHLTPAGHRLFGDAVARALADVG